MLSDPIADFLIQIKNGYMARKKSLSISYSLMKEKIAHVLVREGYLANVTVEKMTDAKRILHVTLAYEKNIPKLRDVVRISKPGRRVYVGKVRIPVVLGGMGKVILSTPKGIMTDTEAKKTGVGGEILCKVW